MKRFFLSKVIKAFRKNPKKTIAYRNIMVTVLLTSFLVVGWISVSFAQESADKWNFKVTPYFWFINVDGNLRYSQAANGSPQVEISNEDLLENLNLGFMLSGEARKGRWSIFTDVIYLDLSSEDSQVKAVDFTPGGPNLIDTSLNAGTKSSFEAWAWTLAGSYAAVSGPTVTLEVLGGFRYFAADASTDWQLTTTVTGPGPGQVFSRSGSISQSEDLWDAVAGLRGQVRLGGSNWYIPYYFDIGAGNSDLTWQGMLGLSYRVAWSEFMFAYRYLYYDTDESKLLEDLNFKGPGFAWMIRF